MHRLLALFTLALAASFVGSAPTRACVASPCASWVAFPAPGSTIPANATTFWWGPAGPADTAALFTIMDGATPVPFTFVPGLGDRPAALTVAGPLLVGDTYTIGAPGSGCTTGPWTITAGPVAPLPTTLGTLSASVGSASMDLYAYSGSVPGVSCAASADVTSATVTLTPSTEAQAWEPTLVYSYLVDGVPSDGVSIYYGEVAPFATAPNGAYERGRITVATICGGEYASAMVGHYGDLPEGTHHVEMFASVVGTTTRIAATPIDVTLTCGLTPDAGLGTTTPPDAGLGTTTPPDAGTAATTGAGGCSVSNGPTNVALLLVACALGLVVRRRSSPR